MGNLVSICGCINEPLAGVSPFGGFFVEDYYKNNSNFFVGLLADNYGLSEIRGVYFVGDKINFEKIYQGRKDKINYDFEFNKKKVYG